jgi:hypothetical protein
MSIDEDEQGDRFARLCVGDEEHILPVGPAGTPVLSHHARALIDYARMSRQSTSRDTSGTEGSDKRISDLEAEIDGLRHRLGNAVEAHRAFMRDLRHAMGLPDDASELQCIKSFTPSVMLAARMPLWGLD